MRIVNLFSIYFLILLVAQGLILDLVDSKKLQQGNNRVGMKTRHVGKGIIIIGILLFALRFMLER
jgi:hypothetical protein